MQSGMVTFAISAITQQLNQLLFKLQQLSKDLGELLGELAGSTKKKKEEKKREKGVENKENVFVMFDLESTGLGTNTAQIIQIAALPLASCGQPSFNRFCLNDINHATQSCHRVLTTC